MAIEKYLLGTPTSLLSTGLNSLANNSLAVTASAFDSTVGQAGDGYTFCDLELDVSFGTAPAANTGISVWLLQSQDGTTFEDGSASITPSRMPDAVFPVRAVTTAQIIIRRIQMPWGKFLILLKNDGTGQAFASSSNALKIRPVTRQMV